MKVFQIKCNACVLSKTAYTVGMQGPLKPRSPRLLIYLDHPSQEEDKRHKAGYSKGIAFVRHLLDRMTVSEDNVSIQFTLKCFKTKQQLKKKDERLACIRACAQHRIKEILETPSGKHVIVAMGPISCEAFFSGDQLKKREGCRFQHHVKEIHGVVTHAWTTYNPAIVHQNAADAVGLYRVLFCAAEDAGLQPKHNPNAKPYDYEV